MREASKSLHSRYLPMAYNSAGVESGFVFDRDLSIAALAGFDGSGASFSAVLWNNKSRMSSRISSFELPLLRADSNSESLPGGNSFNNLVFARRKPASTFQISAISFV